ncbi:hypothetical protein VZ95_16330, partial [Elstera litoralis]
MMRAYPDYQAPGMSVGGFTLFPRLVTDFGYSDNIYARPTAPKASAIGTIAPEAVLRSNWSRHTLDASARAEAKRYASAKDENAENYRFSLGGGLNIDSESQLTAAILRERLSELRGDPDTLNRATEATSYDTSRGEVGYSQTSGRFNIRLRGNVQDFEFQPTPLGEGRQVSGDERSYMTYGAFGRLSYELNPDFTLFSEGGWRARRYDRPAGNGLKSRDSTGPEVGGGVNFALSALWSGEIALGYAERNLDDANFGSVSAMTARAQLLWNVTRATSLRAQALRGINEVAVGPSIAYLSTTYWFGLEHQLQSDLLIGANVSTRYLDYERSRDAADILSVGARATWFINRSFQAQAEVNFSRRDGTQ